jgi:hypothetical protein
LWGEGRLLFTCWRSNVRLLFKHLECNARLRSNISGARQDDSSNI